MEQSSKTAREMYQEIKLKPTRPRFGFGKKPILINIDLQKAYTVVGEFATAYETDPKQLDYVNELADLFREKRLPVAWTYVAYMESGEDCGVWGTRTNTPDSLQNIKVGSRRAEFDDRLRVDHVRDIVIQQAHGISLLRDAPALADGLAPMRYCGADRRLDLRLRSGHLRRRTIARLPRDRSRRNV